MIAEYIGNAALGYLLGSIPFGLVVGYIWLGRDIRDSGSGKTGTTNVLRTAGKLPAVIVMICDIAKAVIPGVIGRFVLRHCQMIHSHAAMTAAIASRVTQR